MSNAEQAPNPQRQKEYRMGLGGNALPIPFFRDHRLGFIPALGLFLMLLITAAFPAGKPVYVTASFVDKRGLFMEDLSRDEVELFGNEARLKMELMARDDIPVVYGLMFDLSVLAEGQDEYRGSVVKLSSATAARSLAYDLVDKVTRQQTVWVGVFQKQLRIVQDCTGDGYTAKAAIQQLHGERGPDETFFYSALFSAIAKMNTRTEKRRVLVVFMDSIDGETLAKFRPLKNLVSSSNVELFVVSFAGKLATGRAGVQPGMSRSSLNELARVTSGEALFAADYGDHLEDISRSLFNQIRTLYTFGFESTADRPFRLTIRCTRPGAKANFHPIVAPPSETSGFVLK